MPKLSRRRFLQSTLLAAGSLVTPSAGASIARAHPRREISRAFELPGEAFTARLTRRTNPIALENQKPGTTAWRPQRYQNDILGFTSTPSVAAGEQLDLFVNTSAPSFDVQVFRLGYYGGAGGRLLATVVGLAGTTQPDPWRDAGTGLASCGNWHSSHSLTIPAEWVSGLYLAKLRRADTGGEGYVVFVVRDEARPAEFICNHPLATYHAYNAFGGKSLYSHISDNCPTVSESPRAVKVSLHCPYHAPLEDPNQLLRVEYPLLYWLEAQGYDLAYCTSLDVHGWGQPNGHNRLRDHRAFVAMGHDEYWSEAMRAAVTDARDAGVHLALFGANNCYWRIRFEPDPVTGQPDRTLVCYKSTEGGPADPSAEPTGTWRDARGANDPEANLLGVQYIGDNDSGYFPLRIEASRAQDRIFRHTGLPSMPLGSYVELGRELVGWEWDAAAQPESVNVLAASPVYGALLTDAGNSKVRRVEMARAHTTRYTATSGAQVFSSGTLQWSWGLALHEPDLRVQQITCNLLADMGLQPATPDERLWLDELPAAEPELPRVAGAAGAAPALTAITLDPGDTTITLRWQADRAVHAQAWLGHSAEFVNEVQNAPAAPAQFGQITLTGLQPGQTYLVRLAVWTYADRVVLSPVQPTTTRWPATAAGARQTARQLAESAMCAAKPVVGWARVNRGLSLAMSAMVAVALGLGGWRWAARWRAGRGAAPVTDPPAGERLAWVDGIKGIALVWIFLGHVVEQLFGYPWLGNPSALWPPLAERIAQFQPLAGIGLWGPLVNLTRYVGWVADNGVQLFLIAGGFGLTLGLLTRQPNATLSWRGFFLRRTARLYPLWWAAHVVFLLPALVLGRGLNPTELEFYLSLIGLRVTREALYYFSPAWWYISLLLQLYLIYPLLWHWLRRFGPLRFLIGVGGVALLIRGAGLCLFSDYLDAWSRGAIFITRLPEFAFGMALAQWWQRDPARCEHWLASAQSLSLALLAWVAGLGLALTLPGMTVAPLMLGVSAFVILFQVLRLARQPRGLQWLGVHSYPLFLMHHPIILALVPFGLALGPMAVLRSVAALLITLGMGLGLERMLDWLTPKIRAHAARAIFAAFGLLAALGLTVYGAEAAIRYWQPQEAMGWGERLALEPHAEFGWTLRPSSVTRLRWETYDYEVTANSLGFPGPEYEAAKPAGAWRIMTLGDAFTSAEGVDTNQAWPRLLEAQLGASLPNRTIQVLNFAITGYGPEQSAAVLKSFTPRYQPDLVILEMYVNDFEDVLLSNEDFRAQIGFGQPAPEAWASFARLSHVRRFGSLHVFDPFKAALADRPDGYGYFLSGLPYLEIGRDDLYVTGRERVRAFLRAMQSTAQQSSVRFIIALVPAPAQVCAPQALGYYPRSLNVPDDARFDMDQPQRVTAALAAGLGIPFYDLRPALQDAPECPYFPRNLHWTATGQQRVADYLHTMVLPLTGE